VRAQLEEAVVRAESESSSLLQGGDASGCNGRLAEALTALANLCARQATALRRQLPGALLLSRVHAPLRLRPAAAH
jgi:hypothetical protein